MRNYKSSDYAINKYSEGIVYKTANQIIEISLDDYLKANPAGQDRKQNNTKDFIFGKYKADTRCYSFNYWGKLHRKAGQAVYLFSF